jgi:flavin reductase (DIM6/NTAB) family NADH-FMN oxidoreductase RutF
MTQLRQDFLDGMSFVAATVNVVATDGPAGRAGVTVSAMSSVSADTDKPVLLVCVNDNSSGAAPIISNGVFTVNILRDDQAFVSDTFAGRYGDKGEDKFLCARWERGATGSPVLRGALASFDCRLVEDRVVGQHHVLFGEVQQVHLAEQGRALVYANRSYSAAFRLPPAPNQRGEAAGQSLCVACLSSFAAVHLPGLLVRLREAHPELQIEVIEGDQAQVAHFVETGTAALGLLYDRAVPPTLEVELLTLQQPYALFAADDPQAQSETLSLNQLAADPLILLDQPLSRDYVTGMFGDCGLEPNVVMRPSSIELVRSLVANGLGYSVLVTRPAGDLSYDGKQLVVRPLSGNHAPISIALARPKDSPLTQEAAAFTAACSAYFGALQPC